MPRRREPDGRLAELLEAIETNARWIIQTEEALELARRHRERLWYEALQAGGSYRQVADASQVDHTTVYYALNPKEDTDGHART